MTADLFPDATPPLKPRRVRPRVLMHVCDAGQVHHGKRDDLGKPLCQMRCSRCGAESDWLIFDTITEAKRGIPCETCNKEKS